MDFTLYRGNDGTPVLRGLVNEIADKFRVPPCALAAICERESNWNPAARSSDGGFGICQVTSGCDDNGVYTPTGTHMLDARSCLTVAAQQFLKPSIIELMAMYEIPQYKAPMNAYAPGELLYFAFGAYNAGMPAVKRALLRGVDPDKYTTNDYCSGTLAIYHRYLKVSRVA